ncbi:MAG: TrmH family RNA methyltransferase [Vicinamibacterales bacterium]
MPIVQLESLEGDATALYRRLRDPELVRRQGLFIAEGRLVVERLLGDPRFDIQSVLLSHAAAEALSPVLDRLSPSVPVFIASIEQFGALTGVNVHRGCLALVKRPAEAVLGAVVASARTVIALDRVSNPDNVGGVFRNAAALGAEALVLGPGCCDPFYRKAIRTSMAATFRVPFARIDRWPDAFRVLREAGCTLVAMTPARDAVALDVFAQAPRPRRLALLCGAEGEGLPLSLLDACDVRVRIPIREDVDSLNVAVAVGIALARLAPPPG